MSTVSAPQTQEHKPPYALEISSLSFTYPQDKGRVLPVLTDASCRIAAGEFCLLVGANGSGKTTLLRLCKPELSPRGVQTGSLSCFGAPLETMDNLQSAQSIGWVGQGSDARLVCDTVWHELAFGLENLGTAADEIRLKVARICHFLGLEPLFRKSCDELSGGQARLVALAAAMVSEPKLLLLDEPTAGLDPVTRAEFAHALFRLNKELGVTVVVATHEPWTLTNYASSAFELKDGSLYPRSLVELSSEPPLALPPVVAADSVVSAEARGLWQRYNREQDWVLRDCSLTSYGPGVHAVLGGNGSGKTTLLGVLAGLIKSQRGKLYRPCKDSQGYLPAFSEATLVESCVRDELMEWSASAGYDEGHMELMAARLGISELLERDPYELSHGERQLVALTKQLLARPRLLIVDEPTAALDPHARSRVACALRELANEGSCVVVASHDISLVKALASCCSLLFDGAVVTTRETQEFFAESELYA